MKAEQFIANYRPRMSEYCPVVIAPDGNIFESTAGHLQTLIALSGDGEILSKIPKEDSPLLYLTAMLHCVIVDYENQIYMGELTPQQDTALEKLAGAGLISTKPVRMSASSLHL